MKEKVQATTIGQPGPNACPDNCLYVPECLRSLLPCRVSPGGPANRWSAPSKVFGGRLWTTTSGALSGPVPFATSRNSHVRHRLASYNRCRPWSHISFDFVTGLPCLDRNTTILTVVVGFSKMAHFVPLQKLPSATETAQLLVQHVFRLPGLPSDVVSDRGPQFSSTFWREFCSLIGAPSSLSSGYHPQSNGQEHEGCSPVHGFPGSCLLVSPSGPGGECPQLPDQLSYGAFLVLMALIYQSCVEMHADLPQI